jgi:predicted transcriptional regulator
MDDTVLESVKAVCTEKAKSIQNLANYGIVERETRDYKKYTVELEAIPANVFQTLQGNFEEVRREKVKTEIYDDVSQMYMDIVEEGIQRSIDGNTYGERQTIEVIVTVWDDECEIDEMEREKLFETIFPQ